MNHALQLPTVALCNPCAWAFLPTHAKVLNCLAAQAGLLVTLQGDRWLWAGEEEVFRKSGLFKPSQQWDFQKCANTTTGEGITAQLFRLRGEDGEADCIGCVLTFGPIGAGSLQRFAAMAATDPAYQAFRVRMLAPLELAPEIAEDAGPVQEGWEGPVLVSITNTIAGSYKARRIFPMLGAGDWRVSYTMARALLADTERQYGASFAALRKRIRRELERSELP